MKWFLGILLSFMLVGIHAQDTLDCRNFKRGVFFINPPEGDFIKIKRTKKYQIEKYNRKGKKHRFSIEWVSDCEYILRLVKTRSNNKETFMGKGLFCKIISGREDYYTCIIMTPEHKEGRTCEVTKVR